MVPKLHAKGKSFRGAAAYLLHDKERARTSERVAWTETRNLATDDPQTAWRIMAATAMDQQRLKAQAGIGNTGRKSVDSVLHLTLSWHPGEAEGLSREEMLRAANGAVRALRAEDRQVLLVCHNDEPQPHVHLLINRVSPEDGRMLPSSKEKLNLSRWAEAYEKERGAVLCEERVLNNAARDRGEYTRGEPDKPRHIYELEAANDNRPDAGRVRAEQRRRDAEPAKRSRGKRNGQARAWSDLVTRHRERVASIQARSKHTAAERIALVRETFKPQWKALFRKHRAGLRDFNQCEQRLLGRLHNTLKAIDFAALVRSGTRQRTIGEVFQAIVSSGKRLEAFRRKQAAQARALGTRQRAEERNVLKTVRRARDSALARNRAMLLSERSQLRLANRMEMAVTRATWKTRSDQRRAAWLNHPPRETGDARVPSATQPEYPSAERREDAPRDPAEDYRARAEAYKQQMRERNRRRSKTRDRGDELER